jgi:ribosome-binding factor A
MSSLQWHNARLKEQLQREIGTVIAQDLRDPRIPKVVTVTEVKLAADTRDATVFVSIFDEEQQQQKAVDALNRASPFIQRLLAARISIKHFPHLYFKLDKSIERARHIEEILKEIENDLE